jgi:hypothetical protein
MTNMLGNSRRLVTAMARTVVGAAMLVGSTSPVFAQARALEGVWGIVTQDRNCATNAAQGSPTRALVTYHLGGTLDESRYIPVFAPGQLSESHGTWSHDGGLTYTGRVVTMIHFDTAPGTPPPVFQAGWMIATQTITLTGADSYTMTGVTQFFNANREIVRTGCASRVAERFK